ncbi:MAG: substrate-binding domain-containing protein [Phycisphaerae bacterium]|nr:substrate-binding domain-containing protein [Phycisphaerae bacterium]NUQ46786.1 substrate-binding domain-containing protein [Phycisphaerae bacterium]
MCVLLAVIGTTGGCKQDAPEKPSPEAAPAADKPVAMKTVGVSLLTQQHDFYKDLEGAMRAAAGERGLKLIIHSAEFDPARQTAQVEDFITQKVSAIVVCPCDSVGVVQIIKRAYAAGIPAFTADIAAAGGEVIAHIASDNVQGGRLAARTMAAHLDGKGEIVVIDHPEVASVQDRVRGFVEEIAKHPEIKIIDRPSAGGMRDKAYAVAENMLQSRPNLKGIFGINDDSALGALRAVGNRDVIIIGYDATPEAREAIRKGTALKADVVQYPDRIGRRTIEAVADHLEGKPVEKIIPIEVGIVDQASLSGGA